MALQLSYSDEFGSTHSTAYHRVAVCELNWDDAKAKVLVYVYKDSTARTDGKKPLIIKTYRLYETALNGMPTFASVFATTELNPVDKNPLANAYTFLKALDEYSGAQDV